jgi:hypothetical protein
MRSMDVNRGWRLRPVIELEPGRFGTCEAPWPGPWTEEQCGLYWRTCLEQSGIVGLEPIAPRSWQVFPDQIRDPATLAKVLEAHFGDDGHPSNSEEVSALSGGFALLHDAEVIVLPGCCGDLGNLADWTQAVRHESAEPAMLWIGHPWLSVRRDGEVLCLQEEHEAPQPEPPRSFRIAPAALGEAIDDARSELNVLFERLLFALSAFVPPQAIRPLADRLVGR